MGKSEELVTVEPIPKKLVTLHIPITVTCEIEADMDPHEIFENLVWDVYSDDFRLEVSVFDVNGYSLHEV